MSRPAAEPAPEAPAVPEAPPVSVILDRDGTLLDFYDMFLRFVQDLHRRERVRPPSRAEILGVEYWEAISSGRLHIGSVRVRDRVDDVVRRYMPYGRLFPGVPQMLTALRDAGVRIALVSAWVGTDETSALLERHGVRSRFTSVLTRDDLAEDSRALDDTEVKRELARRALTELGHTAPDMLCVVGDSPADMALGRSLGAQVVGVRTGNGVRLPGTPPDGPDVLLPSAAALTGLLLDRRPVGAP